MNSNGLDNPIWKACLTYSVLHQEKVYYETFYELGKQQRMKEFWRIPKLLERLKCESKKENNERKSLGYVS
jgi:hypothetical protein